MSKRGYGKKPKFDKARCSGHRRCEVTGGLWRVLGGFDIVGGKSALGENCWQGH